MAIAVGAPEVEIVIIVPGRVEIGDELVAPAEGSRLVGVYRKRRAASCDFAPAVADLDDSGVAVFVDVDSVNTRPQDRECEVRCVDLKIFVVGKTLHPHAQGAGGKLDLSGVVGQIQE